MAVTESFVLPQRMYFVDLRTAETMEALFNPSELEEALDVLYNELGIPGLSHSPLQYSGTSNHKFSFDLYAVGDGATGRAQIEDFRKFLLSLCYPAAAADSVLTGAPPRVLFVWPELVSLQARILSVGFKHQRFALDGGTTRFVASLKLSEVRDTRLTSEDVRRLGTVRTGSAGESSV